MRQLLYLVDSRRYAQSHPYQHQLHRTLTRSWGVTLCSLRTLRWFPFLVRGRYDVIVCALRQRTIAAHLKEVSKVLDKRPVFIYDEDVWEAFREGSATNGLYKRIAEHLNVRAFLVTSYHWCRKLSAQGFPARAVRIGMLPQYCHVGPAWEQRHIRLGFQGSLYPHRKQFFEEIGEFGLDVHICPPAPYQTFLSNLHAMRIFIHSETSTVYPNSRWNKVPEAVARGAFVVRNYEPEADDFEINEFPTACTFKSTQEVPSIIQAIEEMSSSERSDRIAAAVDAVRRRDDWQTVLRAIES